MRSLYLVFNLLLSIQAHAASLIEEQIPNAKLVASGRLSVFIFDVYDASLYTVDGKRKAQPPFALKLTYLRDIKGEKIADQSAEEIRNQGRVDEVVLADWHSQMRHIFPNVEKGDDITGIYKDKSECAFYKNSEYIGRVTDQAFCKDFFDIWFGEKTSQPELRNKLVGIN